MWASLLRGLQNDLTSLVSTVLTLPVPPTEVERAFSTFNRLKTDCRILPNIGTMGSLMLLATNSPPFPFMDIKVFTDKGLRRNKEPVVSPIFRRNQQILDNIAFVNGHFTPERYAQKMGLINLQLQKALFHGKIVFPNCLSS